ncbi:tRNA 2-thiouridine(34) synthase MnmA [Rickettsiales bacterium LUAb2]
MDFPYVDKNAKIVVAMSGGVDSSTVAAMLKQEGYNNLIGVTLFLYDNDETRGISCKDTTFRHDAKTVAEKIGIEHHILDLRDRFDELVITPFINGYINGITPSPCVTCNREMKFGALLEEADKLGADILVTGHYIKWQMENNQGAIYKNQETIRDQSYFLAKVRKEALNRIRFPLTNMTKNEVRAKAEELGLHVAQKPSSNDICFAGGKDYAKLIEKSAVNLKKAGNILDINGNVIGEHQGIFNYTVGQRRGIGVSGSGEPMYITNIDAENNTITIATREHLAKKEIHITNVNWLGNDDFNAKKRELLVKVRASQMPVIATIEPLSNNEAKVVFNEAIFGVARGQVCAFYDQDKLMGGGDI